MSIDEQLDRIDASIKAQGERFDRIDDYLLRFRGEMLQRLEIIDQRLDVMSHTVAGIPALEAKFAPLSQAILDFGSLSSRITRDQWVQKDAAADMVARIEKLEKLVSKLIASAA